VTAGEWSPNCSRYKTAPVSQDAGAVLFGYRSRACSVAARAIGVEKAREVFTVDDAVVGEINLR
jgi:hypothetical protein